MKEEAHTGNTPKENLLDLRAMPDLCDKNFFIPDYQRGYRWGQRQVAQLLDDLDEFFSPRGNGPFYCLQPVVVREMDEEEKAHNQLHSDTDNNIWYEVIDGQQRLTTIRILLQLFHLIDAYSDDSFTICYQTRPQLGRAFDEMKLDGKPGSFTIQFANTQDFKDIDSWHILQAAKTVLQWMNPLTRFNAFKGTFHQNFMNPKDLPDAKSVEVIWYELLDGSDPGETFKRLNDKKVSLNNAELIRSMFLSEAAQYEYDPGINNAYPNDALRQQVIKDEQERKQAHIVEQWDIIERQLRQPDFWAFITKDGKANGYDSRIEYIFDLIAKKGAGQRDELFTFLTFEKKLKDKEVKGLWDLWLKVESCFSMLMAWFTSSEDNYLYYHKIGFLIAEEGATVLYELLQEAQEMPKSVFKQRLDWRIKNILTDGHPDADVFNYSYDKEKEKDLLKRTLTYYNVEATRLNHNQEKFPFDLLKNEGNWTLEHIHAQNSERIDRTDKGQWRQWYEENIKAMKNLQLRFHAGDASDPTQLLATLETSLQRVDNKRFDYNDFVANFNSVSAYYDQLAQEAGSAHELHSLSNMALLSGSVNTAISNSAFEVKRQRIMEKDAKGEYIPYCTRLVFLKYYNIDDSDFAVQQMFYWSERDRKNYERHLHEVLDPALAATDPDIKATCDEKALPENEESNE